MVKKMTNNRLKYYRLLLTVLLFLISILIISRADLEVRQSFDSNVLYGSITVTDDSQRPILLTGTYKYLPDRIISPSQVSFFEDKFEPLNVYTVGSLLNGHEATVLLNITNESNRDLAVEFSDIMGSYKIFVNGVEFSNVNINDHSNSTTKNQIILKKNSTNNIVLQLRRDGFFLMGLLAPPIIDTATNLNTNFNISQFKNIIFCVLILSLNVFLLILAILRTGRIKGNKHILFFCSIGVIISLRISLVILTNFNFISITYPDLLMLKVTSLLLISYLTLLFAQYCVEPRKEYKSFINIATYAIIIYMVFTIVTPRTLSEISYKYALLSILYCQFGTFLISLANILEYKINSVYAFIILIINFIFIYSAPSYYIYNNTYNLAIASILSTLILIFKIINDNRKNSAQLQYSLNKKDLLLDLFKSDRTKLLSNLEKEKNTKNHAIRISEENKNRDASTGLYNRLYSSAKIEDTMAKLKDGQVMSLLLIDIDNLKYINSVYGRQKTDELILTIANSLHRFNNKYGMTCRWDGGTFILALFESEIGTATYIAEQIREGVEDLNFLDNDTATVSIGVVTATNESSIETAERNLQLLIERAKRSGRNCVIAENKIIESSNTDVEEPAN